MARKRCIWATSQPWFSPFRVSSHHYVRYLLEQGWDVAHLSHPISPLHAIRSRAPGVTGARFRNWWAGGEEAHGGQLFHYCPLTLCPPHDAPVLRSGRVIDLWPKFTVPGLRRLLAARGFDDVDLLVLDSERFAFLLNAVRSRAAVLRLVDTIGGFDSTPPSWIERVDELIRRVDHVVVTSAVMADEVRDRGARSVSHVPNGVETERFGKGPFDPPDEYRDIASPRAVYVGAIESWFDTELVDAVASSLPEVAFVLIGPCANGLERLRERENVHVLGPRAYEDLPAYLGNADVGIIPFRSTPLTRCINPIKLYEYMACGLPVVATRSEELVRLDSPATLCGSAAEFAQAIMESARQPADRQRLVAFSRRADWRIRGDQLLTAIGCAESSPDQPVGAAPTSPG